MPKNKNIKKVLVIGSGPIIIGQAAGGSILLKEKMQELGIPMLILDGDGIDRRNSHDGQIRTRLEAFLEMLEAEQKVC